MGAEHLPELHVEALSHFQHHGQRQCAAHRSAQHGGQCSAQHAPAQHDDEQIGAADLHQVYDGGDDQRHPGVAAGAQHADEHAVDHHSGNAERRHAEIPYRFMIQLILGVGHQQPHQRRCQRQREHHQRQREHDRQKDRLLHRARCLRPIVCTHQARSDHRRSDREQREQGRIQRDDQVGRAGRRQRAVGNGSDDG